MLSVLAINFDIPTGFVATDGTVGGPYILARGPSVVVVSDITLSPMSQTRPVGGTATLTATVTIAGTPTAGLTVTFKVIAGPDTGVTGTGTTDAMGHATFSYPGLALGTDTVIAQFTSGTTQTSNNALVVFQQAALTPPSCALTMVITGPPKVLQITVQDADNGLSTVTVTDSTNATVAVQAFAPGEKGARMVVATKTDQSAASHVALRVTDVTGAFTDCDPVIAADVASANASTDSTAGGCSVGAAGRTTGLTGLFALVGLCLLRRRLTGRKKG